MRHLVHPDASNSLFKQASAVVAFVVRGVSPDINSDFDDAAAAGAAAASSTEPATPTAASNGQEGPSAPTSLRSRVGLARPALRRVLAVGGNHINYQRSFIAPHPTLRGNHVVGAADFLLHDRPGDGMERGVERGQRAQGYDRDFVAAGLGVYGVGATAPVASIACVTSLLEHPLQHPLTISGAVRYGTAIDRELTDANVLTPVGATWSDARRAAEAVVTCLWAEVLHRPDVTAAELLAPPPVPPVPPCVTRRVGLAPAVAGPPLGDAVADLRRARLGDATAAAVEALERERPALRAPLLPCLPYLTRAEAVVAVAAEGAATALDVVRRASALEADAAGCLREMPGAVAFLGAEFGWDRRRRRWEEEAAAAYGEGFLPPTAA